MHRKSLFGWLLVFVSLNIASYAHAPLDVETLPKLRSKQYSIGKYDKVVIFSAPRTGSSLVYNVFRFLFEKDENLACNHDEFGQNRFVLKTHRYTDLDLLDAGGNILYIVPIRNPISAAISNYRIWSRQVHHLQAFCRVIMYKQRDCVTFCEGMQESGKAVVFVRYEDLASSLDYLFDLIEDHFSISISNQDKDLMKEGYDKENIYAAIKAFPNFKECLPVSGFHGKHVTLEKYTPPDDLLHWINYFLPEMRPVFERYGYFSD